VGGWVGGWVDGWMDRWMGGWVDGWMDGQYLPRNRCPVSWHIPATLTNTAPSSSTPTPLHHHPKPLSAPPLLPLKPQPVVAYRQLAPLLQLARPRALVHAPSLGDGAQGALCCDVGGPGLIKPADAGLVSVVVEFSVLVCAVHSCTQVCSNHIQSAPTQTPNNNPKSQPQNEPPTCPAVP